LSTVEIVELIGRDRTVVYREIRRHSNVNLALSRWDG